jgi:hypothetical protein
MYQEIMVIATGVVGFLSAVVSLVLSFRTLTRVKAEERLREIETKHREVQSQALVEALSGVDAKLARQAEMQRNWLELRLAEQEKQWQRTVAELIDRWPQPTFDRNEARKLTLQNQLHALHEKVRTNLQMLEGVRQSLQSLEEGEPVDVVQQGLQGVVNRFTKTGLVCPPDESLSGVLTPVIEAVGGFFLGIEQAETKRREREACRQRLAVWERELTQAVDAARAEEKKVQRDLAALDRRL